MTRKELIMLRDESDEMLRQCIAICVACDNVMILVEAYKLIKYLSNIIVEINTYLKK